MESVDINQRVHTIVKENPEFKDVLLEAGFDKVAKKGMLETVGRITTLKQALKMRGVALEELQKIANRHGFQLVDYIR